MDRMQLDDATSDHSSSISSPPLSPHSFSDTINVARPPLSNSAVPGAGVFASSSATSAHSSAVHPNPAASAASAAPDKPKRQRKKKDVGPDGKLIDDGKSKEKKPRKPRESKEKTTANGTAPAAPRKKAKTEPKPASDATAQPRQPAITDMAGFQSPAPASNNAITPRMSHPKPEGMMGSNLQPQTSNTPAPRPISSGQRYDPVRSATIESFPPRPAYPPSGVSSAQASPHVVRASASPSIAIGSLIDPPTISATSAPAVSHSPQTSVQQPAVPSHPRSPTPPPRPATTFAAPPSNFPPSTSAPAGDLSLNGAMDIDTNGQAHKAVPQQPQSIDKVPANAPSSSSAPTPKAARPTPPPAPKGTGSGLLSSSDLFGGPSNNEPSERRGVNIDIQIKLNPNGGNTINIAQEIVKKYGRDAINPRAAAHRERLLQVAAAQNKIEGASDDMGVDLMSDVDGDSNVEMGGMDDASSAQPNGEKQRKRKKKVEEYDKEDDFIDDTELAWQEQAAVSKDGFFVYSGPLIPAVEPSRNEASTNARGGRGRGRGRGRAGAAAAGTTHASLAEKKDPNVAPARARGRGRGTGAPRKPRITKADRERMEIEKRNRETEGARGVNAAPPPGNAMPLGVPNGQQPSYAMQGMSTTA